MAALRTRSRGEVISLSGSNCAIICLVAFTEKKDIEAIEKVQRRFTKKLSGLRDYSYSERLRKLNIQSLELRRIHYDLTLTYQIVFGLSVLKCQEFFN